jgi:G3E family GTPase
MTGVDGKNTALMSVSIMAGPSAPALLRRLGQTQTAGRIGLLTNSEPTPIAEAFNHFRLTGPDPERIIGDIRRISEAGTIDHLVILCEADRPPMAYASLFVAGDHAPQGLTDAARLTGTSFAIDAGSFVDAMLDRGSESLSACFLAEQLEFVSYILLEGNRDLDLAREIAGALNPNARVTSLEKVAGEILANAGATSFDFDAALNGARWRQLLDGQQSTGTIGDRIVAFPYCARRPFHPERFWKLLQHNLHGVFRAKGFFWLASRMNEVGGLNLAGSEIHCASAGTWWAARDQQSREVEMPQRTRAEWQEPFGDRRQSFALLALNLEEELLRSHIDACLLTDAEMAAGPASWHDLPDPFPSWSTHAHHHHHDHDDGCDHDHGSGDHECCHHH